jgi:hypothetical protein
LQVRAARYQIWQDGSTEAQRRRARRPGRRPPLKESRTQIEYVTHSSVRIYTNRFSFLTDPFYFFDEKLGQSLCHFPPRDILASELGTLDYVHSSHVHPDHGDPATLERLSRQIRTAVLPAEHPELEQRYRGAGIDEILLLENARPRQLEDGLSVCCYWSDPVDTVLVLDAGGSVILLQNDCELDTDAAYRLARDFPRIDYAFLRYTDAQSLYPLLLDLPDERLASLARRREDHFLDDQALNIELWKPRVIVPYAMTMTYFQPDQLRLNGYGRMTPPVFCERLRELYGCRSELQVLQPGDRIDAASGTIERVRRESLWGQDLAGYLANIEAHCQAHRHSLPAFDPGELRSVREALRGRLGSALAAGPPADVEASTVELRVAGKDAEESYLVDLARGTWQVRDLRDVAVPRCCVQIAMPASILEMLLGPAQLDAFTVLFLYRIRFRWHGPERPAPEEEIHADIRILETLFGSSRSWSV